jgi:hypothetical protein
MTYLLGEEGRRRRRPGNALLICQLVLIVLFFLTIETLVAPAVQAAKVEGYPEPSQGLRFSWAGASIYRFPARVDGGGTLSVFSLYCSGDVTKQFSDKLGAGLAFTYEYDDYNFSGLTGFAVPRPWSGVQRLGFSVPIFYALGEGWRLIVIPTVQFSGEFGARFGDALIYGGSIAATYAWGPKLSLGLGVGAYYSLAQVRVFPYPIVKFTFSDRFRLTNPFRIGPAGPAGLELTCRLRGPWEVGFGGAYRSYRFRLDGSGPIPNGIGQYSSIPIFARLSYRPSPAFGIDVYGGVSFLNKLYVEDRDGDELYRTRHRVAPLVGLSMSGNF